MINGFSLDNQPIRVSYMVYSSLRREGDGFYQIRPTAKNQLGGEAEETTKRRVSRLRRGEAGAQAEAASAGPAAVVGNYGPTSTSDRRGLGLH